MRKVTITFFILLVVFSNFNTTYAETKKFQGLGDAFIYSLDGDYDYYKMEKGYPAEILKYPGFLMFLNIGPLKGSNNQNLTIGIFDGANKTDEIISIKFDPKSLKVLLGSKEIIETDYKSGTSLTILADGDELSIKTFKAEYNVKGPWMLRNIMTAHGTNGIMMSQKRIDKAFLEKIINP